MAIGHPFLVRCFAKTASRLPHQQGTFLSWAGRIIGLSTEPATGRLAPPTTAKDTETTKIKYARQDSNL